MADTRDASSGDRRGARSNCDKKIANSGEHVHCANILGSANHYWSHRNCSRNHTATWSCWLQCYSCCDCVLTMTSTVPWWLPYSLGELGGVLSARVTVMTFTSPPCLPLSRPWAGWVRGCYCSRSSWFEDHQSSHLLPNFPLSHLDIWQKNWLWAFLPSIPRRVLELVKL